jgi:hypothetical protein
MMRGPGPPPPLGSSPHGIDTNLPNYSFATDEWIDTPTLFPESFRNEDSAKTRHENDAAYLLVGNKSTWFKYVVFGYHCYDHCFQFETQWNKMTQSESDTLTFVWMIYSYHLDRKITPHTTLKHWALDIAQPYLETHISNAELMTINDPREARLTYNEEDPMEMEEDDFEKQNTATDDNWQVVGAKHKQAHTPNPATQIPLPPSPTRDITPPQIGDHLNQKQPANETTTHASTTREQVSQKELNYIHINDGTLRITVKWKPDNYDELLADNEKWNLAATDLVHWMYQTTPDVQIHSWKNGTDKTVVPILDLNPDNLRSLIAPKITSITSYKMFIISIRVSLSTGPERWINSPITKQTLKNLRVDVNISNSTSDSGETIETAGYLFFKNPKHTHRHHYLKHLRSKLPPETPFFDIGYHRKTPTGQTIPHLAIKVGENHVSTLTEILSAHLDGSQTTVFLGRLLISKMIPEEVDTLFNTHADFIANTRILSLAPLVKNIDLIRTEYSPHNDTTTERTTRDWTASLRDSDGSSWHCDVENGSDNREVKLLIPLENLEKARAALKLYKEKKT